MSILVEHVTPQGRVRVQRGTPLRPLDEQGQDRAAGCFRLACKEADTARRGNRLSRPELVGEALVALSEAASRYNPDVGPPFPPYAAMVIRHRLSQVVYREVRRRARHADELYQPGAVPGDREGEPGHREAVRELVGRVRRAVTGRHWYILWQVYAEGRSMRDVGVELGVSKNRVCQLAAEAMTRARKALDVC